MQKSSFIPLEKWRTKFMNVVNSRNKGMFVENIVPFIAVYFAFLLSNVYWLWCWCFNYPWIMFLVTDLERGFGESGNNETIVDTFKTSEMLFENPLLSPKKVIFLFFLSAYTSRFPRSPTLHTTTTKAWCAHSSMEVCCNSVVGRCWCLHLYLYSFVDCWEIMLL